MILIPGSFNDNRQWDDVVPRLDSDIQLMLVELRGHGQSWPPPGNGSIEQFAADVARVAEAEGWDKYYVGGHSIRNGCWASYRAKDGRRMKRCATHFRETPAVR